MTTIPTFDPNDISVKYAMKTGLFTYMAKHLSEINGRELLSTIRSLIERRMYRSQWGYENQDKSLFARFLDFTDKMIMLSDLWALCKPDKALYNLAYKTIEVGYREELKKGE